MRPAVAIGLLGAGGGALLLVAGRSWRSGTVGDLTGRDLVTLLDPVAWLSLVAALLLLLVPGPVGRWVGALVAIAAAALLVELIAAEGAAGWRAAAITAALVVVAGGVAAASGAVRQSRPAAAGRGPRRDDWSALDRGEDPTVDPADLSE